MNDPTPPQPAGQIDPLTDVRGLLRENAVQDERAGRFNPKRPTRGSSSAHGRFIGLLLLGNGAGVACLWLLPQDLRTMLGVVAGMMAFTIALSWAMIVRRDDY